VSIRKWVIAVQAKAAGFSKPQAFIAHHRGFQKPENAGMKREMPFMDGH
jgi:hypothetical protein